MPSTKELSEMSEVDFRKALIELPLEGLFRESHSREYGGYYEKIIKEEIQRRYSPSKNKTGSTSPEEGAYYGGRRRKHSKQTKRRKSHKRRRTTRKH